MVIPDELRELAARRIVELAKMTDDGLVEYGQLSRALAEGGFDWIDPHSPAMSRLLGAVYDHEVPVGSGDEAVSVTALVVHKVKPRIPGDGYWTAVDRCRHGTARGLGAVPTQSDLDWWEHERDLVQERLGLRRR